MRGKILAAVTILAIGGTGALVAYAQPAPPAATAGAQGGGAQGGVPAPGMEMGHHHSMMMHRMHGEGGPGHHTFALLRREEDRKLAPADVQKIAEGFLLWHGNHTWKVTNVAPAADGLIGFSISTPEGSVIAKFTMDSKTAKVTRVS